MITNPEGNDMINATEMAEEQFNAMFGDQPDFVTYSIEDEKDGAVTVQVRFVRAGFGNAPAELWEPMVSQGLDAVKQALVQRGYPFAAE